MIKIVVDWAKLNDVMLGWTLLLYAVAFVLMACCLIKEMAARWYWKGRWRDVGYELEKLKADLGPLCLGEDWQYDCEYYCHGRCTADPSKCPAEEPKEASDE